MKGNQNVGWILVAVTLSLIPHGSGHTMSLWESASRLGVSVYWWAILAGGAFIPLLLLWFGPWVRETGANTVVEVSEKLYGLKMRYVHASINVATWVGITMSETIAVSGAIYGVTGGRIPFFPWAIVIAFVLVVCYVIFGGVMEFVWISTINAIVMTVGSFLSLFFIGLWLADKSSIAQGVGWDGVSKFFDTMNQSQMLNMFNFSPEIITQVIVPVAVLHICACSVAQGMYSPILAAKTNADCRKGFFMATLSNMVTAFPWVIIALVAVAVPAIQSQMAANGVLAEEFGKLGVFTVAIDALPNWLLGLLMISLLTAVLSAGSGQIFGGATVLVNDIIKKAIKPDLSDKANFRLMRIMIIVVALLAVIPALAFQAILFPVFLWCFSFGIPVFVIFFYGLAWKTSKMAAWITLIVAIAVNFWWTFATPTWATGPWSLNMYPVTVVSFVLGTILYAVLPGEKGYLKRMREAKKAAGEAAAEA